MGIHTEGPWRVGDTRGDRIAIAHSDNTPGAISGNLAWVTARQSWKAEAEANARLIAAAPDLLEALKDFALGLQIEGAHYDKDSLVGRALAAIDKAEGRS